MGAKDGGGTGGTLRERITQRLRSGPATAADLSRSVGLPERDVAAHLAHVARSARAQGERLEQVPARCVQCDFAFEKRERLTRPGACPRCKGRRIRRPRFWIAPAAMSKEDRT